MSTFLANGVSPWTVAPHEIGITRTKARSQLPVAPTVLGTELFEETDPSTDRTFDERCRSEVFPLPQRFPEMRTDGRRLAPSECLHELHPEPMAGRHGTTTD